MMTFGGYLNNITNMLNGDLDPYSSGNKCSFQIYGISWEPANPSIRIEDPETGVFIAMELTEIRVFVPAIKRAFIFKMAGNWYHGPSVTVREIAEDDEMDGVWYIPDDILALDWHSLDDKIPEEYKDALLAPLHL